MTFELISPAFSHNKPIPRKHSCDGEDVSPPLQWNNPPRGSQSFALILDDPDAPAGTFVHWVIYNLPADSRSLPEAASEATLPKGARQGRNSFRNVGYGGPCPPGETHRYFFKLYALDAMLNLPARATREQLLEAMKGHILAQAELMGLYTRR